MTVSRRAVRLAGLRAIGALLAAPGRRPAGPAMAAGGAGPLRVLLIRPDHLGDVLLASPAAAVVRAALPSARVEWLVGPWSAEIARRCGSPDAVHTLSFPGFTRLPKRSVVEPYVLLVREAARLRRQRFDAALVLRADHWWGTLLAALAGVPRRFGFAAPECRPFLTDALPPPCGHVVVTNQALARHAARQLGGAVADPAAIISPGFPIAPEEAAWAERWERATFGTFAGSPAAPLVAIHPGSGAPTKQWLPERWAEVARQLRAHQRARIVLTGGPAESRLVDGIVARLAPPPPTLAGATTLGQLGALFTRCALVVGTDSGPLHLAAAVGAPTVRLYGPTDPAEFGPWPPGPTNVTLAAGLPCQPCRALVAPPCGASESPPCLRALEPEAIVTAAEALLAARPSPASSASGAS